MTVAVVVPCFNEQQRLGLVHQRRPGHVQMPQRVHVESACEHRARQRGERDEEHPPADALQVQEPLRARGLSHERPPPRGKQEEREHQQVAGQADAEVILGYHWASESAAI